MAKTCSTDVLDGALNIVKNNAVLMTVCNAQPLTRADGASGAMVLASVVMAPADFVVGTGDTNGRKAAVAAKNAVPVTATGTAVYIALTDATRLLYVTTCTSKALTSGDQVNIPTWDIEIADPL
jgi:hypothetical protein